MSWTGQLGSNKLESGSKPHRTSRQRNSVSCCMPVAKDPEVRARQISHLRPWKPGAHGVEGLPFARPYGQASLVSTSGDDSPHVPVNTN